MINSIRYSLTRFCGAGLLIFISVIVALPAHAVRGVTKVTEVEGITEYRLDNGLKVLLFPDPTKETVTVNVTYMVGSKHENYGETGMAHLLEHLLFKGTPKHPDIPAELSSHGARPNGTTWIDRTNYYETFAATEENIQWALELEADRMVNSFIAKKDLDSEMTVVRNEFERTENSPYRVLMQRVLSTAYLWHNNGKPTIGARADIENVSIERLQAFYKKYYQPDNAVLIVAGQFDPESMLKRIKKTFGKIPKPKRELTPLYTEEPPQSGERSVVVRRVGDIQWYLSGYHIPAGSHPHYAPIEVLSEVLGDTPRGRLHNQLVEPHLAVAAFAYPFELQDPGMFFVGAQVEKDADLQKARTAALQAVEGIASKPITEQEVERAKQNLLKEFDLAFNSSETIAVLLSEYIGMGDWRLLFLTRDRTENVTAADVQQVAEKYLVRNNRTEGTFIPTDEPQRVEIPEVEGIDAMLADYAGREGVAIGEAFDPSYDNIAAKTETFTLPSGTEVALLPKKTRGESVVVQLRMQYGTEETLSNTGMAGSVVGSMLLRGTEKYSREELQDELDKIRTSLSAGGDTLSAYATAETTKGNIVPALELLTHILREPKFDEKEVALLRKQAIANLEASRQEPQAIVSRKLSRFFKQDFEAGHPRYEPTIDEEIAAMKKADAKQLQAFHERFYGPKQMQIAIAGDFDPDEVKATLKQAFDGWSSEAPYQRVPFPYTELDLVYETVNTPDKENAAMVAMMPLPIGENHEDALAVSVGSYIFGGGFLNSRLATRLRQKDGLSYSVGAWSSLSPTDERGEFTSFAIFAPQNMAAVEQGIKEELKKLLEKGVTAEELEAARSGMLQKARVERSQDASLASQLAGNLFLDRAMQWYKENEQQLKELTVEDVNKALKRYLDVEQLSFIRAGDLTKVPEQPAKQ